MILNADRSDRRKSQSLQRAHLPIFADRGDRRIKSPGASLALGLYAVDKGGVTGTPGPPPPRCSLTDLKRSHADIADCYLKKIKKLRFNEPNRFKKEGNEDQYGFNIKVVDAIEEAKETCSSHQFDTLHATLEKGKKILSERQKHILLADISEFWLAVNTTI